MKTKLLAYLMATLLVSCSKTDLTDETIAGTTATANRTDMYRLQKIEFFVNGQEDSLEHFVKYEPAQIYYNKTNTVAPVTTKFYDELTEYSFFSCPNEQASGLQIDAQEKISVPIDIKDGQIVLGEKVWTFSVSGYEEKPCDDLETTRTYTIAANTALAIRSTITVEKISASYVGTFTSEQTGDEIKIEGKWEGDQIKSGDIDENYTPISD